MDIEQLQSFVTLSQTLNYTKAAENLFITQPTLSRHIKHLETELGCQLFERNTKQVYLSEQGQSFLKYATNMLLEYSRALTHLSNTADSSAYSLDFGFLRGGAENTILALLRSFQREHPEIKLNVHDGNHDNLFESLKNGAHDFCLTLSSTLAGDTGLKLLPLTTLKTVLVVRDDHPLAAKESVSFSDFSELPYLCVHKHITKAWYDYVISLYLSHGYFPVTAGTCDSVITLLMQISLGYGITVLTDGILDAIPPNVVAIPIDNVPSITMVVGYSLRNINPAVGIFTEWFQLNMGDIQPSANTKNSPAL